MKKLFTLVMAIFAIYAVNAQVARIVLEAHDVWGDGTGYQLLIDADNEGWSDSYGPDADSQYAQWEYTIPGTVAADDAAVVVDDVQIIEIPAGTYSYLICNPGFNDYGVNYIASNQCDPTNATDYNFEANKTYHFTVEISSGYDCTTLDITNGLTGVADAAATTFSIYPNPAYNVLNVAGEGNAEICNLLGQTIMNEAVNGEAQINISNLEAGVYFVRMNGATQKFIKK